MPDSKNIRRKSTAGIAALVAAATLASGSIIASAYAVDSETVTGGGDNTTQTPQTATLETLTALADETKTILDADDETNAGRYSNWADVKEPLRSAEEAARLIIEEADPSTVTADQIQTASDEITNQAGKLKFVWKAGDQIVQAGDNTFATDKNPGDTITVTGGAGESDSGLYGSSSTLTGGSATFAQSHEDGSKLGVGEASRAYTGELKSGENVTVNYTWPEGKEITAGSIRAPFTYDKATQTWVADMSIDGILNLDNTFKWSDITLKNHDNTKIPITDFDDATFAEDANLGSVITRTAHANGNVNVGAATPEKVKINLTSTRAYDAGVTVTVTRTPAEGEPQTIDVLKDKTSVTGEDFQTDYTLDPLDSSLVGDQYTLNINPTNATDIYVSNRKVTLGDNGSRILSADVDYQTADGKGGHKTVTVTIPFAKKAPVVGNEKAALEGFLVNGQPLEGFDPDQLEYTINADADEKINVKPVAKDGQTVSAGDIRQTANTATQEWTVSMDGQTRVYKVTVVRPGSATADDRFQNTLPSSDKRIVDDDAQPTDADLVSHGYTLNGTYIPIKEDSYQIPEGGVFAYEQHPNQIVKEGVERVSGMTYRYTVSVLAPDQVTYREHVITVTYLTAATHKAGLTGLKVNGEAVAGFDPNKLEYEVAVPNPDQWTVTPEFDKDSGMSVSTHKDGRTATITTLSADGLTTVVYKVTVTQKMKLAETGLKAGIIAGIAAFLVLANGFALALVHRRKDERNQDSTKSTL